MIKNLNHTIEASLARIFISQQVVGCGILITDRDILTCFHVIKRALEYGRNSLSSPKDATVFVDFPLIQSEEKLVVSPIAWDESLDICRLQLSDAAPQGSLIAYFTDALEGLWGHPFRAFGFPEKHLIGGWGTGVIRASNSKGWIQIEDTKDMGYRVQQGFSGGPVWDEKLDAIVGMVVAADIKVENRVAFIIPTRTLLQFAPELLINENQTLDVADRLEPPRLIYESSLDYLENDLREKTDYWMLAGFLPVEATKNFTSSYFNQQAVRLLQLQQQINIIRTELEIKERSIEYYFDRLKTLWDQALAISEQIGEIIKIIPDYPAFSVIQIHLSQCEEKVKSSHHTLVQLSHAERRKRSGIRTRLAEDLHALGLSLQRIEQDCKSVAQKTGALS